LRPLYKIRKKHLTINDCFQFAVVTILPCVEVVFSYIIVCRVPSGLTTIAVRTRKAPGERKPPQTLCQFFSVVLARWQHCI